jgi:hypothetical protein
MSSQSAHPIVNDPRAAALAVAMFLLGALVAFQGSLTAFFQSDDFNFVAAAGGQGLRGIVEPFGGEFFRPVSALTVVIDRALWGLNPTGYHLTNVVFHGLNAWLVCLLASLLLERGEELRELPVLAGLLFLVLPCHGEAVSWISGRTDVIATTFTLGSLVAYVLFRRMGCTRALVTSLVLFLLALMAKESALPLPFVVIAYELFHPSSTTRGNCTLGRLAVPSFFLAGLGAFMALRWAILGGLVGGYGASVHLSAHTVVVARNLLAFPACALDLPFPGRLAAFMSGSAPAAAVLVTVALVVAALAVYCMKRRLPAPAFLLVAFYLALLPVLNLPLSVTDSQGERWVYLPSAFLSMLVVWSLARLLPGRKAMAILLVAASLGYGVALHGGNRRWRNAGELARTFLADVSTIPPSERLFVLSLPDTVGGAYVFRNGVIMAVAMFAPAVRPRQGGTLVARSTFSLPDDELAVMRDANRFLVRQVVPNGGFMLDGTATLGFSTESYSVRLTSPTALTVDIRDLAPGDVVACFSGGRLQTIYPARL